LQKSQSGFRQVKGQDPKRTLTAWLTYDFTEAMAGALGGDAPAQQKMLANSSKDSPVRVGGGDLELDTKEVAVVFGEGKTKVEIDRTFYISARVSAPLANDTEPKAAVTIKFDDVDDDPALTLWLRENMGQRVAVRMDRRQLEIPQADEAPAK